MRSIATLVVNQSGNRFVKLKFKYNEKIVLKIKNIYGSAWNRDYKYWTIPLTLENCYKLKEMEFHLTDTLNMWAREQWRRRNVKIQIETIPGFKCDLRPFQLEGVSYVEQKDGRALIADDMGLGKTAQALGWCQLHPDRLPVIVITTASTKWMWRDEITKFTEFTFIHIIEGRKPTKLPEAQIYIINYDIIEAWKPILVKTSFKVCILDEGHYIQNRRADRTRAAISITKNIPHVIGLTGTPIDEGAINLLVLINIISPNLFPGNLYYKERYCLDENGTYKGAINTNELHKILTENLMIRRRKEDVLAELPDKTFSKIPIQLRNKTTYDKAFKNFKAYMEEKLESEILGYVNSLNQDDYSRFIKVDEDEIKTFIKSKTTNLSVLQQLEILKQLSIEGKIPDIKEWIAVFLSTGRKLVVFCEHLSVIDYLMEAFKGKVVKIDGSVPLKKRNEVVKEFQTGKKIKLFVGNKAAQEGITLTSASDVAVIEYPWTPKAFYQRIDRVHRIGQINKVNVHLFVGIDTVDVHICNILIKKKQIADAILEGRAIVETSILKDLLTEIKRIL